SGQSWRRPRGRRVRRPARRRALGLLRLHGRAGALRPLRAQLFPRRPERRALARQRSRDRRLHEGGRCCAALAAPRRPSPGTPLVGGLDEAWTEPPSRAVRPEAASSVGPVVIHYSASLRPCLGTAIAPRRRARFRQTLLTGFGAALFDPIDDRALARLEALLQPSEALVHGLPAGRDEVDQQREVVHAGVALGKQVAFDPLEPADHLVREPADLGEVASNRLDLRTQAVLERFVDLARQRRLELRGGHGELLDLRPRPLERG